MMNSLEWKRDHGVVSMYRGISYGNIVDLLKKEMEVLDIKDCFIEQSWEYDLGRVCFYFTDICLFDLFIDLRREERLFHELFGERLLQELRHENPNPSILKKLLPHRKRYKISYKNLSYLWRKWITLEAPKGIDQKIEIYNSYLKRDVHPSILRVTKKPLLDFQELVYGRHFMIFQLLSETGPIMRLMDNEKKSFLMMNTKVDKYDEFLFTREQRFLYYFHNPNGAFRNLFFLFYATEIENLLEIGKNLLSELTKEIFLFWFFLLLNEK